MRTIQVETMIESEPLDLGECVSFGSCADAPGAGFDVACTGSGEVS